jgi:hypothetical protein
VKAAIPLFLAGPNLPAFFAWALQYVGKLINKYYDQLPPEVEEELRRLNPSNEKGQRKHKHFQLLSADTGNPHLDKQIMMVTMLMRISAGKPEFERNFEKAFPAKLQLEIPGVLDLNKEEDR